MKLSQDIEAIDIGIYLPKSKTLVFADFHIGFEESLEKQGFLLPRFQYKDIIKRLEGIFDQIKNSPAEGAERQKEVDTIVVNGDLKHEFGEISRQEWKETLALLDFLKGKCNKLVLVRGNHDTILGPIAQRKKIEIVDAHKIGDVLITHGNKIPEKIENPKFEKSKSVATIIIGHEHPAVNLKEQAKEERYKCFLKGKWKGKTLIVQPSFNLVTEGVDVTQQKLLSPFLKKGISTFEVFIVDEKKSDVLYFGKLKDLR